MHLTKAAPATIRALLWLRDIRNARASAVNPANYHQKEKYTELKQ